jgi:hypothetical protein
MEFLHSRFCTCFPDFDNLFYQGSRIYAQILVGAKKSLKVSRRLIKISELFGISQILMRKFFGRREHGCYVAVNMHMIYWINKPIIELISQFNDPRFHEFKPNCGARLRLLPAPSSPYSGIDLMDIRGEFRLQNNALNSYVYSQCLGRIQITSKELQILVHWAIQAQNEYKDADARMFGSSYPIILNLLKESDMLPRVLRLFLREKRRLLRQ